MAFDTRLDLTGLSHLWEKIKALVPAKSKKTQGIFYGEIDSTSTSTVMTATVDGITELADGVAVLLKNGVVTSASGWTLNINSLGAKPVYSSMAQATRITSAFNINYTWLFVYDSDRVDGGCWLAYYGYYSDANTIGYIIRTNNSALPLSSAIGRYRLMFTSADGTKYVPATANTSTSATANKPVTQTPIDPFGRIMYYNYTTIKQAGEMVSVSYVCDQNGITLGYSFAKGSALTMTPWKPVYLKCAPQSDGSAIIDATTPWVQDLPNTEDGKIYIFLGVAYSATNIELMLHHPVYEYKNGAVRLWTNTSVREIPDASQEADGTALVAVDGEWTKQTGYGYEKIEETVVWSGHVNDQFPYSPTQIIADEPYILTAGDVYNVKVGNNPDNEYRGLIAIADTIEYEGTTVPLVYIGNGQLIGLSGGDTNYPFVIGYVALVNAEMAVIDNTVSSDEHVNVWYKFLADGPVPHAIDSKYIQLTQTEISEALGYVPVDIGTVTQEVNNQIEIAVDQYGWHKYTYSGLGVSFTVQTLLNNRGRECIWCTQAGHDGIYYYNSYSISNSRYSLYFVCQREDGSRELLIATGTSGSYPTITFQPISEVKSCMTVKPSTALTLAPTANPLAVTLDASTSVGTAFTADGTGIVCNKEMDVLISGNCTWRSGGASVVTEVSIRQMGSGVQVRTGFAGGLSGVQNQHTITLSPFILHVQQNDTIQMTIKIYFGTANGDYTLNVGENWLTVQEL